MLTKSEARRVLNFTFEIIVESMKEGKSVKFPGFAKFYAEHRPERIVMNPRLGKKAVSAARVVPRVRFSTKVGEVVNTTLR
ncbi:MAG: hypothetical protein GF410_02480 [Chitinivibrionales bacterium]|nr:hypothetical protein [Chitinivibrionales bacterium]